MSHTIAAGSNLTAIAITPNGKRVYVTCGLGCSRVVAISTVTHSVVGSFSTSQYWPPAAIAITPDGTTAYVPTMSNYHSTIAPIDVVDLAANTSVSTWPAGIGTSVAIAPDGKTVYVGVASGSFSNVDAIDVATNTATTINLPSGPTFPSPTAIAITPDGTTAYVAMAEPGTVAPSLSRRTQSALLSWLAPIQTRLRFPAPLR